MTYVNDVRQILPFVPLLQAGFDVFIKGECVHAHEACSTANTKPLGALETSGYKTPLSALPLMVLDWNVFFTYTTFLTGKIDNLAQLAVNLLGRGVAVAAHHSDGFLFSGGRATRVDVLEPNPQPLTVPQQTTIKLPEGLEGFEQQCALQFAQFRFFDYHNMGPLAVPQMEFIRFFTDPCIVTTDRGEYDLYPMVTVYKNGVINVHLRLISASEPLNTDRFVEEGVNLSLIDLKEVLVPPAVFELDSLSYLYLEHSETWQQRQQSRKEARRIRQVIEQHAETYQTEDFEHQCISINPENNKTELKVNLSLVFDALVNCVWHTLNVPRFDLAFLAQGPKTQTISNGSFWSSRPNIFLFSTFPQKSLEELDSQHAFDLAKMMSRSIHISKKKTEAFLGKPLETDELRRIYFGDAGNLFIYAPEHEATRTFWDPNFNDVVFLPQSMLEFANYLQASLWKCEEVALHHARTVEDLIANREHQTVIEQIIRHPSAYGELNEWYEQFFKIHRVSETRAAIIQNTALKLEKFKEERNFKRQKFQWGMAALFGLLAAMVSGSKVVEMVWTAAKIARPRSNPELVYMGLKCRSCHLG